MADEYDRFLRQQYYDAYWNSKQRTIREYDFFSEASEKLKQEHVLPWPENPEALQEFFLPELISPLHKQIREMETPVGMVESGIVIKNAEPLIPPATAGVFLFGKRLDDSPATAGVFRTEADDKTRPSDLKGKGEMVESGIVIKNAPEEAIPKSVFLFHKMLEYSDLIPGSGRFLIPKSEKLMGFLSEEERIKMEGGGGVTVILEGVEEKELVFAKMEGSNDVALLLKDDWGPNVKVGDHLLSWGSRRHDDGKFLLEISIIKGVGSILSFK